MRTATWTFALLSATTTVVLAYYDDSEFYDLYTRGYDDDAYDLYARGYDDEELFDVYARDYLDAWDLSSLTRRNPIPNPYAAPDPSPAKTAAELQASIARKQQMQQAGQRIDTEAIVGQNLRGQANDAGRRAKELKSQSNDEKQRTAAHANDMHMKDLDIMTGNLQQGQTVQQLQAERNQHQQDMQASRATRKGLDREAKAARVEKAKMKTGAAQLGH